MKNVYVEDWNWVKERFTAWWNYDPIGYPLLRLIAPGKPAENLATVEDYLDYEDKYTNAKKITENYRNYCKSHWFLGDAFPALSLDLGPSSMALYLGSEPLFKEDTVWFTECIKDWDSFPGIRFDENNRWWRKHLEMIKTAHKLADNEFLVNIPDIIENIDIISAMRGPQELCYDLMDRPEVVKDAVNKVDELYFKYYDAMYDIVKEDDGSSAFTAFMIWGHGKTAKVQCDFCALMSPDQFREIVQPNLRRQCQQLNNSIYHLDGPDSVRHLPALMEIKELNSLQWTCGAGKPDGGNECWYPIYDQVREAGKSLWVHFADGSDKDWVESSIRLIKRYGPDCFYFIFPDFPDKNSADEALDVIRRASSHLSQKSP